MGMGPQKYPGEMDFTNPSAANQQMINTVNQQYKPYEQQLMGNLKKRGLYGGDLYSPTVQAGSFGQLGASKTGALTDLWFKSEANNRAWDANRRSNILTNQQYDLSEMQIKQGQKQSGNQTVICTMLYRRGLLSYSHLKADIKFLKEFVSPEVHNNYLRWALPLVSKMYRSWALSVAVFIPVWFWSAYMMRTVDRKPLGARGRIGGIIHRLGIIYGEYRAMKGVKSWAY
jgi:hypothetical protein